jgi:hypothetical protein
MKSRLLLPNRYKTVGTVLLIPSFILGVMVRFFDFSFAFLTIKRQKAVFRVFSDEINLTDELALTGIVLGLLFIAFAREKNEDEFIAHTRLESLKWAVLVNYALLLIATWVIHGMAYIDVMMYNMLTILIFFIIRFHFVLRQTNRSID